MGSPIRMVSTRTPGVDAYREQVNFGNAEDDRARRLQRENTEDKAMGDYAAVMPLPQNPQASVIRNVATQPGGGAVAMKLAQTSQNDDKSFSDQLHTLLKSNSPEDLYRAKQMSQQRGGVLPDAVFDNAKLRAEFVGMLDTGKQMGFTSPEQFKPLVHAFFEKHMGAAGTPAQQTVAENIDSVPQQKKVATTYKGEDGSIGVIEQGFSGATPRSLNVKGTVTGRGAAGARGYEFQAKIAQYTKMGVPEEIATNIVLGKQVVTPNDIARITQNLMKMKDENFEPRYKTIADAQAAAVKMAQDLRSAATSATAPTPTTIQTPSPSAQAPAVDAGNLPVAPPDPRHRVVGATYKSPNGAVGKWTGTGWEVEQ